MSDVTPPPSRAIDQPAPARRSRAWAWTTFVGVAVFGTPLLICVVAPPRLEHFVAGGGSMSASDARAILDRSLGHHLQVALPPAAEVRHAYRTAKAGDHVEWYELRVPPGDADALLTQLRRHLRVEGREATDAFPTSAWQPSWWRPRDVREPRVLALPGKFWFLVSARDGVVYLMISHT